MKNAKKILHCLLVGMTTAVFLTGLFWVEGFFYAKNIFIFFAGITLILFLFVFRENKIRGEFEEDETEVIAQNEIVETVETEELSETPKKIVLINYYLHRVDEELKDFNDAEAKEILQKAQNQLQSIEEKTLETKDLEEKVKTYEKIINLRNRLK
jgi:hypothetical protein